MRIQNSIRNLMYGYVFKVLSIFLNFATRIIFIKYLSIEYLGANGLFSNILGILSFAELGIGGAITFCLYKPLEDGDEEKVKSLIKLFRNCYRIVSVVIIVFGVGCIPFLDVLTNHSTLPNLPLIYFLYLLSTVITYFGADRQSLLIADQKQYLVTRNTAIIQILQFILQFIVISTTRNFIGYLIVVNVCQILTVAYLYVTANKYYPYLKEKNVNKINADEKLYILKNIKAMFMHKVGAIFVNNTDNIIISYFLGLATVGISSNFMVIINSTKMLLLQVFNATNASVGSLNASNRSLEYKHKIFERIDFLNFSLYFFSTSFLAVLMKPLIELLGKEFGLDDFTIIVLCMNFLISGFRVTVNQFKDTAGLFVYDKYKPIFESIVNLAVSLILVKAFGLVGVFLGTLACQLLAAVWWEQWVLFKYMFNTTFIKYHIRWYIRLFITLAVACAGIYIRNLLPYNGIGLFTISLIMISILTFAIYLILYFKNENFIYYLGFVKNILKK